MTRNSLTRIAALTLTAGFLLAMFGQELMPDLLAGALIGACSLLTVRCTIAAARIEDER